MSIVLRLAWLLWFTLVSFGRFWRAIGRTIREFWKLLLILAIIVGMCGCQKATKDISASANAAAALSRTSENRAITIKQSVQQLIEQATIVGPPAPDALSTDEQLAHIDAQASCIIDEQQQIQSMAGRIQARIPDIQDRPSDWLTLFKLWAWVILIAVIVIAAIYFGLGSLIRRFFMALGWFIPQPLQDEAALDRKVIRGEASHREVVAFKRAYDPQYRAAWDKVR
jgi:hypothetical protein